MTHSVHCTDLLFSLVANLGAQDRQKAFTYTTNLTPLCFGQWLELEIQIL